MTNAHAQSLMPIAVPTKPLRCSSKSPGVTPSQFDTQRLNRLLGLVYPAVPTSIFATFWDFAAERQRIFFRRFNGFSPPWTNDPVLATHRFTNAYRAADRVSQYLIRYVQNDAQWSKSDLFFRTILFKFFNRVETWETIVRECGQPQWSTFSAEQINRELDAALAKGQRIYSGAYIMPSGGPRTHFRRKHRMHVALLERMMRDRLPAQIANAKSMAGAFELMRAYPTIGDFLAYQYVTDLNYSELTNFDEADFVAVGPGSREGIDKCFASFGGKSREWIIRRVAEIQEHAFDALELVFPTLWGRPLQLIDCQNLFCEVAKYARVRHPEFNRISGRTRIKQKFVANTDPIQYVFPRKWCLTATQPISVPNVAPD